jgi:hypothetical protein
MTTCKTTIGWLRQFKVLDQAIFDWIAILIPSILIGYALRKKKQSVVSGKSNCNGSIYDMEMLVIILTIFYLFMVLGIIVHYAFNIPTMFNYVLGLNSYQSVIDNRKAC